MVQQIFGQAGLDIQWELPRHNRTARPGPGAADQANQITNQTPRLTGSLAPMANDAERVVWPASSRWPHLSRPPTP